jgi:hypothetical protein
MTPGPEPTSSYGYLSRLKTPRHTSTMRTRSSASTLHRIRPEARTTANLRITRVAPASQHSMRRARTPCAPLAVRTSAPQTASAATAHVGRRPPLQREGQFANAITKLLTNPLAQSRSTAETSDRSPASEPRTAQADCRCHGRRSQTTLSPC